MTEGKESAEVAAAIAPYAAKMSARCSCLYELFYGPLMVPAQRCGVCQRGYRDNWQLKCQDLNGWIREPGHGAAERPACLANGLPLVLSQKKTSTATATMQHTGTGTCLIC